MWLTDLADVARSTGLPVIEVPGWKTRGHGPMTDVRTIIAHHTAGPATGNYPSLRTVRDGRPGLAGPLAQLGLARDGTVYVIAAGLCWHAGESCDPTYTNSHAVGIEAEATGTTTWPERQMDAYARLCRALMTHYRLPLGRVLGHKETCAPPGRKPDPNFSMDAFRARITALEDDMALTDDDVKKVVSGLLTARLTNTHNDVEASLAAWLVYGNEKAGDARDNAANTLAATNALRDSLAGTIRQAVADAVKASLADGTIKVDITVNGAQS